jgi:uncharacterized protein
MFVRTFLCFSLLLVPACKKVEAGQKRIASQAIAHPTQSTCETTILPWPPALEGRVTDKAAVFDEAAEKRLTQRFADWENTSGHQIVLVTLPTLSGIAIERYACTLGNAWEIGDKDRNDGVMILYAMKERQVRISVGLGLERELSNAFLLGVIEKDMLPELSGKRYERAADAALDKIAQKLGD